ncbi:MAG TPA: hypothetical protein PLR83_00115 [Pyrinomonadaceae bacterium]|nr:hypothetical protein [Pyrinomonadaceae bacterium]
METRKSGKGWCRDTYADKVDIRPRGEELDHIPETGCACRPRISHDVEGRTMIIHNSWDGREDFERAASKLPPGYIGRRAA